MKIARGNFYFKNEILINNFFFLLHCNKHKNRKFISYVQHHKTLRMKYKAKSLH